MYYHIVIYLCSLLIIGTSSKHTRIVGGVESSIEDFPHIVAIKFIDTNALLCAGTIISNRHILTAAHCFYGKEKSYELLRVYTGITYILDFDGPVFKIDEFLLHPQFDGNITSSKDRHNDIAVLKLNEAIMFNRFQKQMDLPSEDVHEIDEVILWGWGVTTNPVGYYSDKLRQVTVQILEYDECVRLLSYPVSEDQICTQTPGKSASMGDSGGPVVSNGKLIGIISFNNPWCQICPEIHCNIFKHLDFIRSVMTM